MDSPDTGADWPGNKDGDSLFLTWRHWGAAMLPARLQMRVTVAARSTRPTETVSVHPPCGMWPGVRYEGKPSAPRHHFRTSVSIAAADLALTWNTAQDLPAFPAVLRQAQPGRVRDADLRSGEFRVDDEIHERCAVRLRQGGRRAVRGPPLELVSFKPGAFRIPSAHDVHRLHRMHRSPCTALASVKVIWVVSRRRTRLRIRLPGCD
jgi:hypothetical protein